MEERLQKILARAGYGSRRSCETLISAGRVAVNGKPITLGAKADPQSDRITVDGRALAAPEPLVYIALHKPRFVLSTVDAPDPRPTVIDLIQMTGVNGLPVSLGSLYPVGRLDAESEGLILLTNDGELANRLTHPKYGHEKEYRVLVARHPDAKQLEAFQHGIVLEDGYRTAPAQARIESLSGKGAWLRIILREGRKRQIRETCALVGLPVVRILRIRIGSLTLGRLKAREWRYLTAQEVSDLKATGKSPVRVGGGGKPTRKPAGQPRQARAPRRG